MRIWLAAPLALMLATAPALAAQGEGTVRSIDREKQTITLESGETYKLPGEFDATSLEEGMTIVFAYDEVNGQNLITDIIPDE